MMHTEERSYKHYLLIVLNIPGSSHDRSEIPISVMKESASKRDYILLPLSDVEFIC